MTTTHILAIHLPFMDQSVLLLLLALLFFGGKRLPEMGKSLGKGIIEFKKGLRGIEDDLEAAGTAPPTPAGAGGPPSTDLAAVPQQTAPPVVALPPGARFDPFTGKPLLFDPYTGKPLTNEPAGSV